MEKFSFSIFSIFYGVFATFWLIGTSSRTVNAAKSLDFPVKFYQTLSQTHEKTQKFQKPGVFIIWIYVKYTCMQYQFDRLNITIRKKSKTFFAHLIFLRCLTSIQNPLRFYHFFVENWQKSTNFSGDFGFFENLSNFEELYLRAQWIFFDGTGTIVKIYA